MEIIYGMKWVTIARAAELSGRSTSAINHLIQKGHMVQGTGWKYDDANRVMINLVQLDLWVDSSTSKGSMRGKLRHAATAAA